MSTHVMGNPSFGGTEYKFPIYKDMVSVANNLADGKLRFGDVTSVADLGMGILSTALDPIGAILGSAVDFLMNLLVNSIKPLGDAVNWLLGDPPSISAASTTWRETGVKVVDSGNAFVASLGGLGTWEGPAAESYRGVVRHTHGIYNQAAQSADGVATWISVAGAVVATFREFMWGMLKDFITEVVKAAIAAVIAAVPSLGASVGAFTAWFGARMAMIAGKFTRTLSKLMTKMGDLCQKLGKSGRSFYQAAEKLRQLAGKLGRSASHGFGSSGVGRTPRMPGDTNPDFNRYNPGYQGFKDGYKTAKRGTEAMDKGADIYEGSGVPPVQDLPDGY